MFEATTFSPEESIELGFRLGKKLVPGTAVAFFGGLGMGKTTFTKGIARALGVDPDEVTSPTFALVNIYEGSEMTLCHFDMYRIESWEDLYATGFFEYLDAGCVLVCEWSENVERALPEDTLRVCIERGQKENERQFRFEGFGKYEDFSC